MRSRGNDELRNVGRGGSLNSDDVLAHCEQIVDVRSGRLGEEYRNCRTVFIRFAHSRIKRSQLYVDLVSVSGRAVVVVVAVGVALVDVEHRGFGIHPEERQAKQNRD